MVGRVFADDSLLARHRHDGPLDAIGDLVRFAALQLWQALGRREERMRNRIESQANHQAERYRSDVG